MPLIGNEEEERRSMEVTMSSSRSFVNRRALCEKLRTELKYDVFSFDYRGFGDSTGEPTEEGLIKDARHVYDWLQRMTDGRRRIYIWGQSLGSAVACQLAARLSDDESLSNLAGLVMEAPFINIHQALQTHWFAVVRIPFEQLPDRWASR